MNSQNITPNFYTKILDISDSEHTLEMFFVYRDKSIKKAKLSNNISEKLAENFLATLQININEDTQYIPIEKLDDTLIENEYLYFNGSNIHENIQHLFSGIDSIVECADTLENDIFGLFFRISSADGHILLYQQCYAMSFIKKGSITSLLVQGGVFKEINANILNISYRVDFLIDENFFLIFNLKPLENQYGYKDIIEQQAQDILNVISAINFIENLEIISDNLTVANAKKIKNCSDDILQMCENQIGVVRNFIENHCELKKYLKFDSNNKIQLKNKKSANMLVNFLTDSYLYSNLTNIEFESRSKKKLSQG